jgi:hypothetical protein
MSMDAHHAEYIAAACGLHEQTPTRRALDCYAIGDHISFRLHGWSESSYDDGRVTDHHNGKLLIETADDIVEVDPHPWPLGNVLPF